MRMWVFCFFPVAFLALFLWKGAGNVRAETVWEENAWEETTEKNSRQWEAVEELGELERFLDKLSKEENPALSLSFPDLMEAMAKGRLMEVLGQAALSVKESLFYEITRGGGLILQVAVIGLMGAVFSGVSSVFKGSQISDTGFFVTYLLLFTCLAASFLGSLKLAEETISRILEFMRLLMPAYYMAVAFSGGSISALALYEGMLGAVTLMQWLGSRFLLPFVKMYVLLVFGDHAMKEPVLTRLCELLESLVGWSLKTMMGLVMGIQFIQSLVLPYADAVGSSGAKRLLGLLPGVGAGAEAAVQMVLGSGVLMKNSMGAAAMVALAVISLIPALKLAVLMVTYQCVAAFMQPLCDKRMVSCVCGVAKGHGMLLKIVLYSLFLFLIAIAVTCASTNAGYFAA